MPSRSRTRQGAKATTRRAARSGGSGRAAGPRRSAPARQPRRTGATFTPFVVLGVIVALAWTFYPVMRVQYREERSKARLEAELGALKNRNAGLQEQVKRLKTPEGVEDVARETLGLVRQGENAYVVMDGDEPTSTKARFTPDRSPEPTETVLTQVLDTVFGVQ